MTRASFSLELIWQSHASKFGIAPRKIWHNSTNKFGIAPHTNLTQLYKQIWHSSTYKFGTAPQTNLAQLHIQIWHNSTNKFGKAPHTNLTQLHKQIWQGSTNKFGKAPQTNLARLHKLFWHTTGILLYKKALPAKPRQTEMQSTARNSDIRRFTKIPDEHTYICRVEQTKCSNRKSQVIQCSA